MANLLIAAALGAVSVPATPAVAPALPDADPAMWVVNDHDTVIYLFGTFHALDGKTDWFNDEVLTAFAASDELVLETIIPDLSAGVPAPMPAPQVRRLAVAPTASFLASTRVAINAGRGRGMEVEMGADAVLRRAAEESGKTVAGLETFQSQLDMFASITPSGGAGGAEPKPKGQIGMSTVMDWMQTAWNRGDQKIFTNLVEQMRKTAPVTYDTMFTRRNVNWAAWIANRLDRPGTVFVAVGAGHLAGIDSVQAKLADLGVKSERIN